MNLTFQEMSLIIHYTGVYMCYLVLEFPVACVYSLSYENSKVLSPFYYKNIFDRKLM